jgi:hypothetical protein
VTPQALLQELHRFGITIDTQGAQLILDGPAAHLTDTVVAQVRAFKEELLRLLDPDNNHSSWDVESWQAYFDERAGVREYDGRHERTEAERLALEDTITHWLRFNLLLTPDPRHACIHCNRVGQPGNPLVAAPAGCGHAWVHEWCWTSWSNARQHEAYEVLRRMGLKTKYQRTAHHHSYYSVKKS